MKDAAAKGRLPAIGRKHSEETKIKFKLRCGDKAHKVILKEKEVLEIKQLLKRNLTCIEIASIYNVSRNCISEIKSGRNWKHLEECT